jgi:hypothetical protein
MYKVKLALIGLAAIVGISAPASAMNSSCNTFNDFFEVNGNFLSPFDAASRANSACTNRGMVLISIDGPMNVQDRCGHEGGPVTSIVNFTCGCAEMGLSIDQAAGLLSRQQQRCGIDEDDMPSTIGGLDTPVVDRQLHDIDLPGGISVPTGPVNGPGSQKRTQGGKYASDR